MDIIATVTTIIDRLAHSSTNDQDALNSVYGLRRLTKGNPPSQLLYSDNPKKKLRQLNSLVAQLRSEIAGLKTSNHDMQGEIQRLQTVDRPTRDHANGYSYDEVMEIIRRKFGKQNGGLTLWSDYNAKLHAADPTIEVFACNAMQTWRRLGVYPVWAVEQLLSMPIVAREIHKWSPDDIEFLCQLHLTDLYKTDDQLAAECSRMFGCEINSNSIKSKFNILRKENRIPALRPKRS
jgi:hypothetical protein